MSASRRKIRKPKKFVEDSDSDVELVNEEEFRPFHKAENGPKLTTNAEKIAIYTPQQHQQPSQEGRDKAAGGDDGVIAFIMSNNHRKNRSKMLVRDVEEDSDPFGGKCGKTQVKRRISGLLTSPSKIRNDRKEDGDVRPGDEELEAIMKEDDLPKSTKSGKRGSNPTHDLIIPESIPDVPIEPEVPIQVPPTVEATEEEDEEEGEQRKLAFFCPSRLLVRFNMEMTHVEPVKADKSVVLQIAEHFKQNRDTLLVRLNGKTIPSDATVEQLKLTVADLLECIVIDDKGDEDSATNGEMSNREGMVTLFVQNHGRKSREAIQIRKDEAMSVLFARYCKKCGIDRIKVKFMFDGDVLDGETTPQELDLEGEEVIDAVY